MALSSGDKPTTVRHVCWQEIPLPICTAFHLHSATRKRQLVDNMYHLGLSISYDRMLQISTDVAYSVCKIYNVDDVVCPAGIQPGLLTMAYSIILITIPHQPLLSILLWHMYVFNSKQISIWWSDQTTAVSKNFSMFITCIEGRTANELPVTYTHVKATGQWLLHPSH